VWEFLPLDVMTCAFLFMQFVDRGSYWLQESISDINCTTIISPKSFLKWLFDLHRTHLRSCVSSRAIAWLFVKLVIPPFCLVSYVFSFVLCTKLGLPHPLALGVTHCICGEPLDLVGTHFLCYCHGGEWTTFHNVIWVAFASIAKDVRFHISHDQTHVLPPPSFPSFHQWVDIVLPISCTATLALVVITNPTWVDLVFRIVSSHEVAMIVAILAKEGLYHDWHLTCAFLPFAIQVFGCLHHQVDDFLQWGINIVWLANSIGGFSLAVLGALYKWSVSNLAESACWIYFL